MPYILIVVAVLLLILGPSLWIKFVMWRHSGQREEMPGTGGELANHLIERFALPDVTVVEGQPGQDHYNPATRVVSLSPDVYHRKSLTAVAVAAHEVGHAIQFSREEPVSKLRDKYLSRVFSVKRAGTVILTVLPLLAVILKSPMIFPVMIGIGVLTMLASTAMYAAILPEEFDASFNKALPILAEGYIPGEHMPAVRQVLRAAALTYVAAALVDVLRLWRWLRFIR